MKKGKKWIIALCAVLLLVLIAAGVFILRQNRMKNSVAYTNYIACSYLDISKYAQARTEAQRALQMRKNDISKELIVLSYCYEKDYTSAEHYCEMYLTGSDPVLQELKGYIGKAMHEPVDIVELYKIYMEVKSSINLSEKKLSQIQSARDILVMRAGTYSYDELSANMALLEKKKDAVSLRALAYGSRLLGEGDKVVQYATELVKTEKTTANVTAVANAVASHYQQTDAYNQDAEVIALNQKITDAASELSQLQQKYSEAVSQGRNADSISRSIEKKTYEMQDMYKELNGVPYERAINYISAQQPPIGSVTGLDLEIARLNYIKGDEEKAEEILMDLFTEVTNGDADQYLEPEIQRLLKANGSGAIYNPWTGEGLEAGLASNMTVYEAAELVEDGLTLGFAEEGESSNFVSFLAEMAQKYKSILKITRIDARNFPLVKVGFSTSLDDKAIAKLGKKDFDVLEGGSRIAKFELKKGEDLEGEFEGKLSVCFVLDVSGSMEGDRIVNAKRAAGNFMSYLNSGTEIGLVAFESSARTISPLTQSSGLVAKGLDTLYADGGTSIAQGLLEGVRVLETAAGSPVIVLLSDGEDGDAAMIDSVISTLLDRGITVYSIGVGGADESYLRNISESTGGNHVQAQDDSMLGSVYKTVSRYIVNDFEIQFEVETDLADFERNVKLIYNGKAFDEKDYHVGVSAEDVLEEENKSIITDFYQQRGGSARGGNSNE